MYVCGLDHAYWGEKFFALTSIDMQHKYIHDEMAKGQMKHEEVNH